jgi:hypothetical protein
MGGRVLDYLAQGIHADRPLAADMPALIQSGGAAVYYSNDGPLILNLFNADTVDWDELDITALSGFAFQLLSDVDWTTPPTDGQVFVWHLATTKFIPYTIPAVPTVEQIQDLVGAMGANGTGTVFAYDDPGGFFTFNCTITQYTDELAQDALAAAFAAGTHTGLTITYDDALNKFSFTNTITQYTDEMAQDTVAAMIAAGTHVGVVPTYNDAGNALSFTFSEASSANMWAGTSSSVLVTPKKIFDMAAPVSVAYAATVTLDLATGLNFDIGSLTGPITLANFTNAKPGQSGVIHFVQDGTGGRVITYGSNFRAAGGLAVGGLLSTAASAIDECTYFVRTDGKIVVSILKDVKA